MPFKMYFFDTYAIIEIIRGNTNYEKYKREAIVTSSLNIGELYYINLKKHGKKTADYYYKNIKPDYLEITPICVVKAFYFRFINKKKGFSLIDCIGYILALDHGLIFLTGDIAFKGISNVEFVK